MARRLLILAAASALATGAAACKRSDDGAKAASPSAPSAAAAVPATPPLASEAYYRVDAAAPPACAAGKDCEVKLQLTALGDYKVNEEYPFKFVADPSPGLAVTGDGTFAHTGKQSGAMTVKLRAEAAGTAELVGTFKLSVCTEAECKIEEPKIALAVPVQ